MPSNEEKTVSFPADGKGKKGSKGQKPQKFGKSIGWFFGMAILIFILKSKKFLALLFVLKLEKKLWKTIKNNFDYLLC